MPNEYETPNHTNGRVCLNGMVILFVFLVQNSWVAHKIDHKTYTSSIIIHRPHCVSFFRKLLCACVCALFVQFSTAQCFPLVKTEFIWKLVQFMTKTNYIFRLTAHTTADTEITAVIIIITITTTTTTVKIRTTKLDHLTHLHNTHAYQLTSFWIPYFPKLFVSLPTHIVTYES